MSCPDWTVTLAWRDGDGPAPPEWQADLDHLGRCPTCRRRVAELDPTVLLASAASAAPQVHEDEVATLTATVRSMMAAERLAARSRPDRRALIAAGALVALLATSMGVSHLSERSGGSTPQPESVAGAPEAATEPPIEEVQPAAARVYQLGTEELPVVLIFDESLDL